MATAAASAEARYLLELVQGVSGENFLKTVTGWVASSNPCDWDGITCTAGEVTEIDLSDKGLEGTLPNDIGKIESLSSITLVANRYTGPVPASWAALPLLKTLDLAKNSLDGTLPVLASATVEFYLLGHNNFTGTLPDQFGGNAASMFMFDVGYNQLTGTIPSLENMFPVLETLDLSNNMIAGKLPTSIARLITLKHLFLSNNYLSGTIPKALGDAALSLESIYLRGNILTGTIPESLEDLRDLTILFIDDNKLTGQVPQALCDMNLNELFFTNSGGVSNVDVTYNELYGNRTSRTRNLNVITTRAREANPTEERDGCTSIACPPGYRSQSNNTKDGVFPCELCENESLNPYLGSDSCFDNHEDHILQTLYVATQGESWTGAKNWADPTVKTCAKEGVTCNDEGQVTAINLYNKGLAGHIPLELGFLVKLTSLDLSYNKIGGQLPADLKFSPLVLLNVAENLLTGFVPRGLCQAEGINGNGEAGVFTCDTIACRAGYYSSTGRAAPGLEGEKCRPCPGDSDVFVGLIQCNSFNSNNGITPFGLVGEIALAIMGLGIMFGLYWVWRRSKVSQQYIVNRAYDVHGPGKDNMHHDAHDHFSHPEAEVDETDPLGGIDGLGQVTRMEVQVKDEWSSGKETQKEVWLDVPKIS